MRKDKEIYVKKLLNSVKEEVASFMEKNNMKDSFDIAVAIGYIQLLLKEASVSNAVALYYLSHKEDIPLKYIDNLINSLHTLFIFVLDKQKNKGKILSLSEIAENFKIWQTDPVVLHGIITKIYFILRCLMTYFAMDKRWLIVTGDLCYLFPRVSLSFMDVKAYQQNDELNNLSLGTIKKNYHLLIAIFQWTTEECLKIYAINHEQRYWCFRGLNILYTLSNFYMLENNLEEQKIIQDRMEAIRKRMYIENKDNNSKLEADLSAIPLEELLKIDAYYNKS